MYIRAVLSAIDFDVWGCRGSRNLVPESSAIGTFTSCYSVLDGDTLFVVDAGSGLMKLAASMQKDARFQAVRFVRVLLTHAHMDHWEGLKDVEWFWRPANGLHVEIFGTRETLEAVERGFQHPSFVPLRELAEHTVASLRLEPLARSETRALGEWTLSTAALHHYSGPRDRPRFLDTLGYRLSSPRRGVVLSFLFDHEPTAETRSLEDEMIRGAQAAVIDSQFVFIRDQAYGHGSQEHTAILAGAHPETLVLAGHISPNLPDETILAGHEALKKDLANFDLAREGRSYRWTGSRLDRRPGDTPGKGGAPPPSSPE